MSNKSVKKKNTIDSLYNNILDFLLSTSTFKSQMLFLKLKILQIDLFKSLYYNLIFKNLDRKKILIFYKGCKIKLHKSAHIKIKKGILLFNKGANYCEPFPSMLEMHEGSSLIIENNFTIRPGTHIIITKGAILKLGSGYMNRHVKIKCFRKISIGENVVISENVTFWDSDAHKLGESNEIKSLPIKVGNNVWIGTNAIILKGVINLTVK